MTAVLPEPAPASTRIERSCEADRIAAGAVVFQHLDTLLIIPPPRPERLRPAAPVAAGILRLQWVALALAGRAKASRHNRRRYPGEAGALRRRRVRSAAAEIAGDLREHGLGIVELKIDGSRREQQRRADRRRRRAPSPRRHRGSAKLRPPFRRIARGGRPVCSPARARACHRPRCRAGRYSRRCEAGVGDRRPARAIPGLLSVRFGLSRRTHFAAGARPAGRSSP